MIELVSLSGFQLSCPMRESSWHQHKSWYLGTPLSKHVNKNKKNFESNSSWLRFSRRHVCTAWIPNRHWALWCMVADGALGDLYDLGGSRKSSHGFAWSLRQGLFYLLAGFNCLARWSAMHEQSLLHCCVIIYFFESCLSLQENVLTSTGFFVTALKSTGGRPKRIKGHYLARSPGLQCGF